MNDEVVERDLCRKKKAQFDDLVVERDQHNQKKAQQMITPLLWKRGFFFGGHMRFIFLSDKFYNDFSACPEILQKKTRPYLCLTVDIDGVRFAIPLRHHVSHKYCFPTVGDAALDYTKAVVIRNASDVSPLLVQIDQATYNILKSKGQQIENGFRKYLKLYKKAMSYPNNPHYSFIRTCSSLQYFIKR